MVSQSQRLREQRARQLQTSLQTQRQNDVRLQQLRLRGQQTPQKPQPVASIEPIGIAIKTPEELKKERVDEALAKIDDKIKRYQRLAEIATSEDDKFRAEITIGYLNQTKSQAKTGDYLGGDLVSYAESRADARIARTEFRRELKKAETSVQLSPTEKQYKDAGFTSQESQILAQVSEARGQSISKAEAKTILASQISIPQGVEVNIRPSEIPKEFKDVISTEDIGGFGQQPVSSQSKINGDFSGVGNVDFSSSSDLKKMEVQKTKLTGQQRPTGVFLPSELPEKQTIPITFETVGQVGKNIFDFGRIGKEGFGSYFEGIFEPLEGKGTSKTKEKLPLELTDISSRKFSGSFPSATGFEFPKIETFGQLQTSQELAQGLVPGVPAEARINRLADSVNKKYQDIYEQRLEDKAKVLQKQINEGKLTLDQAQTQFNQEAGRVEKDLDKQYTQEFSQKYDTLKKKINLAEVPGIRTTKGDRLAKNLKTYSELGAYALAFTNPVTATLASGIIAGSGSKPLVTGIAGTDLSLNQRLGLIGTGVAQYGLGALGARATFGAVPTSTLARQSQKQFLKELEAQPFSIGGKQLVKGSEGDLFKISGSRTVGGSFGASQDIDILAPTFRGGSRVTGARATSRTRVRDVISGVPLKSTEELLLGARTGLNIGVVGKAKAYPYAKPFEVKVKGETTFFGKDVRVGKGGGVSQFDLEGFQGVIGTGFIKKKGKEGFREFLFSGAGKKTDEGFVVLSGKPTKIISQGGRLKIRSRETGAGELKNLRDNLDKVFIQKPAGIKKTPLSKTFGQETIQVQEAPPVFAKSFVEQVAIETKPLSRIKTKVPQKTVTGLISSELSLDKLGQKLSSGLAQGGKLLSKQKTKQLEKTKGTLNLSNVTKTVDITKQNEKVLSSLTQREGQLLNQRQQQVLKQISTPVFTFAPSIPRPRLEPPRPKPFSLPKFDFGRGYPSQQGKQQPSDLFIKSKGRDRKVGKTFVSKQVARDTGAYFTDHSLSATFKVKPSKKKPVPNQFNIPPNYFQRYGYKFRPYKVRKGVKKPLTNQYIEKSTPGYRLDTRGEIDKIQVERLIAQQNKSVKTKKARQRNFNKLFNPMTLA